MHFVIKNVFQFNETKVLIAGIAKLIFDCCYPINFGFSWLLNVDSPPQLVIRSMRTLLKQIIGLKFFLDSQKVGSCMRGFTADKLSQWTHK